jgi:hypothetical protein
VREPNRLATRAWGLSAAYTSAILPAVPLIPILARGVPASELKAMLNEVSREEPQLEVAKSSQPEGGLAMDTETVGVILHSVSDISALITALSGAWAVLRQRRPGQATRPAVVVIETDTAEIRVPVGEQHAELRVELPGDAGAIVQIRLE